MEKTDEKQLVTALLSDEQTLAEKYARLLCSEASVSVRTKLGYAQRGVNEAAENILDEINSRGWRQNVEADDKMLDKIRQNIGL